ncbi:MAG: VWA domain-containing protein, partial [Myxococcota bacterium]
GHEVNGPRDPIFERTIAQLTANGGTDLHAGLVAGYRLARKHARRGRVDRVVLVSDGQANVGITDERVIGRAAKGQDAEGIYLIGVGVGTGYNDQLMEQVTDLGRGASVYIHDDAESARMFGQRFLEAVDVAARDVKVRYDLPPGLQVEMASFSGEEISTEEDEVRPQHIAPNDAMVLFQRLRACAPLDEDARIGVTVEYRDAVTLRPKLMTQQWRMGDLLGGSTPQLDKGVAMTALLDALAAPEDAGKWDAAAAAWGVASKSNSDDPDLPWMKALLRR